MKDVLNQFPRFQFRLNIKSFKVTWVKHAKIVRGTYYWATPFSAVCRMSPNDIAHFCTVFAERNGDGGRNYKMSQKGAMNSRSSRCSIICFR